MDNEAQTGRATRTPRSKKRLRAHVDYQGMSVSYGRVKLGVPAGFKEMLEIVTREILREQPKNIPGFLAAYFDVLNENQKKGCTLGSLVTERIVETVEKPEIVDTATQGEQIATQEACTQDDIQKEAAVSEVQTENIKTSTSDAEITAKPEQEVAEQQTNEVQTADVESNTGTVSIRHIPVSSSTKFEVITDHAMPKVDEKLSHISLKSISELPDDIRMVNCEVICKASVELLAEENNNNNGSETNEVETQEVETQEVETQEGETQEVENKKSVVELVEKRISVENVEPMSLEEMEANGISFNCDDEEIVVEEEADEVVVKKDDGFFSGKVFTPEDVEEVERDDLPTANQEGEAGETLIQAIIADVEEEVKEEVKEEEKAAEEEAKEESAVEDAVVEESAVEEATVEEAAVEEAPVEEAAVEESAVDEAAVEETAVEEPKEETPITEEAKNEETVENEELNESKQTVEEAEEADNSAKNE